MKKTILLFFIFYTSVVFAASELDGFTVVREFGCGDTAALFGLLSSTGNVIIKRVSGPTFLGGYRLGKLNSSTMSHIFLKSSLPMDSNERKSILSKYKGAKVIYFEGYHGSLCQEEDVEYRIIVNGEIDHLEFEAVYQLIALPNKFGDCTYHKFAFVTRVDDGRGNLSSRLTPMLSLT